AVSGSSLLITQAACAAGSAGRPISDFLDAQGTTNAFGFNGHDQIGWSSAVAPPPTTRRPVRFALVDYCGFADKAGDLNGALGTSAKGSISERTLSDGRAEVTVILHTTNALTWALTLDINNPDFAGPLDFGARD